ncbi:MAG: type 4a pilus biogenesis protein PilO [Patescibacteria group bacterium]
MEKESLETGAKRPAAKRPSKILGEYYGSIFFAIILTFLAMTALVLKPKLDVVKGTNAEVTVNLQSLEQGRTYLESLERSISAAEGIPPSILDQVDRALPRETGVPELLVLFGDTATKDGVKISNISFAEESESTRQTRATSTVSEVSINLSVTAVNYAQIKRFLRDIETSLRIIDVTGINVSTQGKESAYAILLKTYVYKPLRSSTTPTPSQRL